MPATIIFPLAVWLSGTNQNSVPANDNALRMQAVLGSAVSIANAAPPTPAEDSQYVIGTTWGGFAAKSIVIRKGGAWYEFAPVEGMLKTIGGVLYQYAGAAWGIFAGGGGGGGGTLPTAILIACSDEATALTAGVGKVAFRMPHAMTLTGVRASLTTAQTSGVIFTVDVNEGGATIISTKLTVDNAEKTSTTAATPAVISDTALADDTEITIDIDQVGDGTAKGLKVYLIGTRAA